MGCNKTQRALLSSWCLEVRRKQFCGLMLTPLLFSSSNRKEHQPRPTALLARTIRGFHWCHGWRPPDALPAWDPTLECHACSPGSHCAGQSSSKDRNHQAEVPCADGQILDLGTDSVLLNPRFLGCLTSTKLLSKQTFAETGTLPGSPAGWIQVPWGKCKQCIS